MILSTPYVVVKLCVVASPSPPVASRRDFIFFGMDRQRGTVKWFSREKGWGFIQLENGEDIFVHHSDVVGEGFVTLEDGAAVEFSVEEMEKGPRARDVRTLDEHGEPRQESGTDQAGAAASAPARSERTRRDERDEAESGGREKAASDSGGRRPLAEQLREKLGKHFPGLGG